MKTYCITDKGLVRELNEDYYYLPRKGEYFAIVADGMGGHNAGEVASRLATETFASWLRLSKAGEEALQNAFMDANAKVLTEAAKDTSKSGMGTTLTAVWYTKKHVYLGHIGDSRAYRLRDGKIAQISSDHSYVAELVRNHLITPEKALTHPRRNVITRCIGVFARAEADIERYDYKEGDVWFLCTDGLTGSVSDKEINAVLNSDLGWEEKLIKLKNMALERGGTDNITMIAVTGGKADE